MGQNKTYNTLHLKLSYSISTSISDHRLNTVGTLTVGIVTGSALALTWPILAKQSYDSLVFNKAQASDRGNGQQRKEFSFYCKKN